MNRIWTILSAVIIVALVGRFIALNGKQWEIGRFGMPRSLVGGDGNHYLDGTAIDPITLSMISHGCEEEMLLVMLGVMLAACAWRAWTILSEYRMLKRNTRVEVLLQMITEKQDQGKWEEAEELLQLLEQFTGWKTAKMSPSACDSGSRRSI